MNVKFLNPFVEAATEVLTFNTHAAVERGELRLETGSHVTDDVTVVLSLVGAVDGTVFLSMSTDTAVSIASAGLDVGTKTLDRLTQSGIAELGNVITGSASTKLAASGFESNISTPSLIVGKGATISTLEFPRVVVPLVTSLGHVTMHLALRERTPAH